ncbi:MAG: alpha-glucuronidase [Pedobacter sp.]
MKWITTTLITILYFNLVISSVRAEDGHELWLNRKSVSPVKVICAIKSPVLDIAVHELTAGWNGTPGATIVLNLKFVNTIKNDGFILGNNEVRANSELGILYGVYELLRRQSTGQKTSSVLSNPSYMHRILNHWDNLNGTVERGYAGNSIFWRNEKDSLTVTAKDKALWTEYARANASIGINGTVLNNVNASPAILTAQYLQKVKAIAEVMRPYGLKTYLSVNFSSPVRIGGLKTADPLNPEVKQWWTDKVREIYKLIPDFGGLLVKANSEGQPGPQDFGRTHVDGANMLADALKPYQGIVMWRAFVYSPSKMDRVMQAYSEFLPFDGQFRDNVIIQVKNGPLDFQPREPFSPLFGGMKKTAVMPELQITQEYLGRSIHLVYLAPSWEEFLKSDTYLNGTGSTVAKYTDGRLQHQKYTAIAGVANIGLDTNWCGHDFAQSNWYAFGRLAWNNGMSSTDIADEWLKLTFTENTSKVIAPLKAIMMHSREAAVNYMMPLGLHHIFAEGHHYGPAPWFANKNLREDWTSVYYHKADTQGIGFNRTRTGSNAVGQYNEPLATRFNDPATCPEEYLLWFHHLPWNYRMKSGATLWNELCFRYDKGVIQVRGFQNTWNKLKPYMDQQRFVKVQKKLERQYQDAQIWKDACLLYFQQFSQQPIPAHHAQPTHQLKDLITARPLGITH